MPSAVATQKLRTSLAGNEGHMHMKETETTGEAGCKALLRGICEAGLVLRKERCTRRKIIIYEGRVLRLVTQPVFDSY